MLKTSDWEYKNVEFLLTLKIYAYVTYHLTTRGIIYKSRLPRRNFKIIYNFKNI